MQEDLVSTFRQKHTVELENAGAKGQWETFIGAQLPGGKAQAARNGDGVLQLGNVHRQHLGQLHHAGSAAVGHKDCIQQALQRVRPALISLTVLVADEPLYPMRIA